MKMHELKTINPYFSSVWDGVKKFEIRKNDRGFECGDILWLREYTPRNAYKEGSYSGRELLCQVIYLLSYEQFEGLASGYCVMGIIILQKREV